MERRPYRPGGHVHAEVRLRRYKEAERQADNQLRSYFSEPSQVFSSISSKEDLDTQGHVVFEASNDAYTPKEGRKADIPKKRGDRINNLLEKSPSSRATDSDRSFIRRHFGRICRFAKTLRNKGKLHPAIEEILDL